MSVGELLSVVRPAGLVNPDSLLDAIAERTNSRSITLPHRGQLRKFFSQLLFIAKKTYYFRIQMIKKLKVSFQI